MPSRGAVVRIMILVYLVKMTVSEKECRSALRQSSEIESQFKRHFKATEVEFKCSSPRLRAVSTNEIIQENGLEECLKHFKVEPSWTMLYRCESSGCCENNMACVSNKEDDDVPVVFRIRHRSHKNKQRYPMFIELMVKNHTSCICDDIITK